MKKTNDNLIMINGFFIMSLLVANVVAGKVVQLSIFQVPAAVVAYGITFLCTDIIGELWGKDEANKTVRRGFYLQIVTLALIFLAIQLKPASFMIEYNDSFKLIFGQSARMILASMTAYLISQANDVLIFHKIKQSTGTKMKWLRNNISTLLSQAIDTAIFITIAFYGVVPNLGWMIVSQYIVKAIIALLDTPFFYFFTREQGKGKQHEKDQVPHEC